MRHSKLLIAGYNVASTKVQITLVVQMVVAFVEQKDKSIIFDQLCLKMKL